MKREATPWKTEAELCDAFMDAARAAGWTCYPETAGWDILLVHGDFQVGVQAKVRATFEVLEQAIPPAQAARWDEKDHEGHVDTRPGPHVRAVLVPVAPRAFAHIGRALRVYVFAPHPQKEWRPHDPSKPWRGEEVLVGWAFHLPKPGVLGHGQPEVRWMGPPEDDPYRNGFPPWAVRHPEHPEALPAFVPDLPAGVPCPVTLSPWKVSAFAVCRALRANGYVTSKDFKDAGISPTTWFNQRWLRDSGERIGRLTKYVAVPGAQLPDEMYPRLAEQCAEHAAATAAVEPQPQVTGGA